jgi:hypothetical protein
VGESYRGQRFEDADFNGTVFRGCDLRNTRMAACWLEDVSVDGLVRRFFVNGVDVAPFVEAELDRQNPERAQLHAMTAADDYRVMWDTIEELWTTTVTRARRLPERLLHERVDDEWSFVETLRHLVFATDAWVNRAVLDAPQPFHQFGVTHSGYPIDAARSLGIVADAAPTLDEVLEMRRDRLAIVRSVVEGLTDESLKATAARTPAPHYPEQLPTVGECVRTVMGEEVEHRRFATRDLTVLETR